MHFIKQRSQVGVEETETEIRAVKVIQQAKQWRIVDSIVFSNEEFCASAKARIIHLIKKIREWTGERRPRLVFGIRGDTLLAKRLSFEEKLSETAFEQYLRDQAKTLFHYSIDEVYYDFFLTEEATTQSQWQLYLVKRPFVNELVEAAHSTHCHLLAIDAYELAYQRGLHFSQKNHVEIEPTLLTSLGLALWRQSHGSD